MGSSTDGGGKAAFGAYDELRQKQAAQQMRMFKVALVAGDCLLLGLQPVLVHLSKNDKGTFSFNPVSVNLLTELAKTAFALATLLALGTGRPGVPMYRSLRAFVADARHNRLLVVPAALYAVNNYLKFAMQLYFRPTTTKMLGNLKVFTIAILMRTVLGRTFSVIQYEALFLLVAGITVNQLQGCSGAAGGAASLTAAQLLPAALCVAGSVTVPAAASVYNELALKKHMDTSVHLQNFFLYFYGAAFNLLFVLGSCVAQRQGLGELFAHQSWTTSMLVVNNAAQGILSSFFYKFADSMLKKYSSTIATIFTALLSWAWFSHPLTLHFGVAVSIVAVSMHQFLTFGGKTAAAPGGGGGGGGGSGVVPNGSGGAGALPGGANGWQGGKQMLHSPSMEHFRVTASASPVPPAVLAALAIDAETGGGGLGSGGSSSARQPLLPR